MKEGEAMRFKEQTRMGIFLLVCCLLLSGTFACKAKSDETSVQAREEFDWREETPEQRDARMAWWREARFGLFIHWGLYAVPAGEWNGETRHAEWIRTTAQIPLEVYDEFAPRFNPVKFDPADWVRMAKQAGMKYVVITSKHHDGFSLFDSKHTEFDVTDATPFKRDIMAELAEECRKQGIVMCWYHSIMDWHHPDYLPRRNWEADIRSAEGADMDRYVAYMKNQVRELVSNYGRIGVLWFDGEWEATWNRERGLDLYDFVRSLQPDIIINNRVGVGRAGMAGTYDPETASGDFGTPEQEIPATGLGYDWETCMTMNRHWGYNKHDDDWKSTEQLVQMLVDIVSKGGNFLLNVGPTAEGLFPPESVERLAAIGRWMDVNGESIYGTTASLFEKLEWGRSTTKADRLYLHVFDWPQNGKLNVPGLLSQPEQVFLVADPEQKLKIEFLSGSAVIALPEAASDPIDTVIALTFRGQPEVINAPKIFADGDIFIEDHGITLGEVLRAAELRYTVDGNEPAADSTLYTEPFSLDETATVKCRYFRQGEAVSAVTARTFTQVQPHPAASETDLLPGLRYTHYEGEWDKLPFFKSLSPVSSGVAESVNTDLWKAQENLAVRFTGYVHIPEDGIYVFSLASDDGSRLLIGDEVVVDNDGLHGSTEIEGRIALQAGIQPLTVEFFQRTGGMDLELAYRRPGAEKQTVPPTAFFHK
jgi:alpha-L-fucosidase